MRFARAYLMPHSYKFAIVRLEPNDGRGERLNLGIVVLRNDSLDVRVTRSLDRARVLSAALDKQVLVDLFSNFRDIDDRARREGPITEEERFGRLARLGPLSVVKAGQFMADSQQAYESRISTVLERLIEPEPAPRKVREKRTRLYSQVKRVLKDQRILARKEEGLDSHRFVAGYELDDGLVADLVLRNGAFHVFETVDASGDEASFRKAVSEIAISALVIERAKMRFGEKSTKARLIYSTSAALEKLARPSLDAAAHQGIELVNWASLNDRNSFLITVSPLAHPIEDGKGRQFASILQEKLFH
ncbi:DUF3037 domain-containing protein [Mesorhizobium sp. M1088]|uniref:DUF3037 domain-containing protein n=1 Tax=unclassified Mesorhizobium TaxID=325217 RepID=UPI0033384F34